MEPKKNPKADVHTMRSIIFNSSLVLSLVVVITAFRWSTPIPPEVVPDPPTRVDDEIVYVPITDFSNPPEQPKPIEVQKAVVHNPVFQEVKELIKEGQEALVSLDPEPQGNSLTDIKITAEPEEDPNIIFTVVQTPPTPVDGKDGFYNVLRKNLKYPRIAIRNGTEGRVFVEFVVERDGAPTNMKVVTGISRECDEEAMRVLSLTKWNAGKQRGKPVRVKMILPVTFKLQN